MRPQHKQARANLNARTYINLESNENPNLFSSQNYIHIHLPTNMNINTL